MTKDSGRELLAALVQQLRRGKIEPKLAAFAADAIQGFLEGDHKTLETAFGIGPRRRGRPRAGKSGKHWDLALEITKLRCAQLSWHQISSKLNWQGDARDIQEIFERYEARARLWYADETLKLLRRGD
jgi:hypothetical protein